MSITVHPSAVATTNLARRSPLPPSADPRRPSSLVVLAMVVAVAVIDQTAKWWAWRNALSVTINHGGDMFVGDTVSAWFSDPFTGSVLDVVDSAGLALALYLLLRSHRSSGVLFSGGLFLAGWISNTIDRLGVHNWTAPGSGRGVVDFVRLGTETYNLADLCIGLGAAGLAISAIRWMGRGHRDLLDAVALAEPAL